MIIPDTNLLVYAHNREDPHHNRALSWWHGLVNGSEELGVDWSILTGFVRIVTLPSVLIDPLSALDAVAIVERWLQHPHIVVVEPQQSHLSVMTELLIAAGRGGNLVPDAHIAALAIEHDAEVHTNDRDFARFPGLRWSNPLQASV